MHFKYNEDHTINELLKYVESTYGQHYVNDKQVQLLDVFFSDPKEGMVFCKTNAIKYLMRFGKKDGNNQKDLLKAMHYIVLMKHCAMLLEEKTPCQ